VRLVEAHGGSSFVLTLGPPEAEEQLRDALAIGIDQAMLLETDGSEWGPIATAEVLAEALRNEAASAGGPFDAVLFGNEAADSGEFQVGVRVAHALGLPAVTGIKGLEIEEGVAVARREGTVGTEIYEVALPAVFTVREGINLPRFPSVPGRLRAKKKEVTHVRVDRPADDPVRTLRLSLSSQRIGHAEVLGTGPEAAPAVVDLMQQLGVVAR
jgi:electron transfer flavoprotein beta subunit